MSSFKFTPEMFREIYRQVMKAGFQLKGAGDMWEPDVFPDHIAAIAQKHLDEWLSEAPVVYGASSIGKRTYWDVLQQPEDTYQAKLVCIEELKPKVCEHEPDMRYYKSNISWRCRHCFVDLTPKWTTET